MKIAHLFLLPTLFFSTFSAESATCDAIDKISADIQLSANKKGTSTWDLAQLKQNLGEPTSTKILGSDKFYRWETMIVFEGAEGNGAGNGYYPGYDPKNGIKVAKRILGKPLLQVTDDLTQYEWKCSPQRFLIVTAYDNQTIKKASGVSCLTGECQPFSVQFESTSQAETTYKQQMKLHGEEISTNGFNLFVKGYNEYFHATITNQEQLNSDMLRRRNLYFTALGKCKPGEYSYASIPMGGYDITIYKFTILGEQNGRCAVETISKDTNELVTCRYPMDSLTTFSDLGTSKKTWIETAGEIDKLKRENCQYKKLD